MRRNAALKVRKAWFSSASGPCAPMTERPAAVIRKYVRCEPSASSFSTLSAALPNRCSNNLASRVCVIGCSRFQSFRNLFDPWQSAHTAPGTDGQCRRVRRFRSRRDTKRNKGGGGQTLFSGQVRRSGAFGLNGGTTEK